MTAFKFSGRINNNIFNEEAFATFHHDVVPEFAVASASVASALALTTGGGSPALPAACAARGTLTSAGRLAASGLLRSKASAGSSVR